MSRIYHEVIVTCGICLSFATFSENATLCKDRDTLSFDKIFMEIGDLSIPFNARKLGRNTYLK